MVARGGIEPPTHGFSVRCLMNKINNLGTKNGDVNGFVNELPTFGNLTSIRNIALRNAGGRMTHQIFNPIKISAFSKHIRGNKTTESVNGLPAVNPKGIPSFPEMYSHVQSISPTVPNIPLSVK